MRGERVHVLNRSMIDEPPLMAICAASCRNVTIYCSTLDMPQADVPAFTLAAARPEEPCHEKALRAVGPLFINSRFGHHSLQLAFGILQYP